MIYIQQHIKPVTKLTYLPPSKFDPDYDHDDAILVGEICTP